MAGNGEGRKVKILHVWNTAGVASVIAKFMDRAFATESSVIARKRFDRTGLTTYGSAYDDGAARFTLRALSMARRADLVHVHSFDRLLPWLRRLYASKPLVMHYHGADIISKWESKRNLWSKADLVAYSTPDLSEGAPAEATYAPTPVDTDLFYPRPVERQRGSAVSIRYGMDEEAEALARKLGVDLSWLERGKVAHGDLPSLFSRAEYYIDLRKREGEPTPIRCVGKAALEALACGCRAVDWSGRVHESLMEEHRPERVAAKWHSIYDGLLGKRGD